MFKKGSRIFFMVTRKYALPSKILVVAQSPQEAGEMVKKIYDNVTEMRVDEIRNLKSRILGEIKEIVK